MIYVYGHDFREGRAGPPVGELAADPADEVDELVDEPVELAGVGIDRERLEGDVGLLGGEDLEVVLQRRQVRVDLPEVRVQLLDRAAQLDLPERSAKKT